MDTLITFSQDMPEEHKKFAEQMLKARAEELTRLCVIYNPSCGCRIDQFVVLDRFPMSEKIISRCPECKKGCYMEISDPLIFHLPLNEEDYTLEQMKDMVIMEGPQKPFLEAYKKLAEKKFAGSK